jgi:hypothetical protein
MRMSGSAWMHAMGRIPPETDGVHSRKTMSNKQNGSGNEYRCAIEKNQNGKYTVRVRAAFGRRGWVLPVYFLASTFDTAMKRLEEALQLLQRNEERLWFFGRERSDDPNFAEDLLVDIGLRLDRRTEFPRKMAALGVAREKSVPAVLLAPVRRALAEAVETARAAVAGD